MKNEIRSAQADTTFFIFGFALLLSAILIFFMDGYVFSFNFSFLYLIGSIMMILPFTYNYFLKVNKRRK